jgi:predicted transcriptional regulator of viral defense system
MNQSKYATPLSHLTQKPVFTAAEARALAIPTRMLTYFCRQGLIERIGRGLYRGANVETGLDFAIEELVVTALSIPNGTICLLTALCLYELTDQLMREYWIAVPNTARSPKRAHTRIVRMRNTTLGATTHRIGNYEIKIFDRARTVVDAFRYLSHEIAIKALQSYIGQKGDLVKLSEYAKQLRVNITPYIMALTT